MANRIGLNNNKHFTFFYFQLIELNQVFCFEILRIHDAPLSDKIKKENNLLWYLFGEFTKNSRDVNVVFGSVKMVIQGRRQLLRRHKNQKIFSSHVFGQKFCLHPRMTKITLSKTISLSHLKINRSLLLYRVPHIVFRF